MTADDWLGLLRNQADRSGECDRCYRDNLDLGDIDLHAWPGWGYCRRCINEIARDRRSDELHVKGLVEQAKGW